MKLEKGDNGEIIVKECYVGLTFVSADKEVFGIVMRDSGFEFNYQGKWYEAKNGEVKELSATKD